VTLARADQYFRTLNTNSGSLMLPVPVMNELFTLKNIFDINSGYDFILFTPEKKPVNSFGMTVAKNHKPVTLFNKTPYDPASVFFYTPEQLNCESTVISKVEKSWETMLEEHNVKTLFKQKGNPWWLFLWR
jgi:hypothetical protein